MSTNEDALSNVRRKVAEVLDKDSKKLVFGWRPGTEQAREEGERWEDSSGKRWEMKNGIRQTITKLDGAKTPWWCPKCSKPLNHKNDVRLWKLHGHCVDCQVQFEMKLRREGTFEEYVLKSNVRSIIAELREKIAQLQEYHDTFSTPEFINSDGTQILGIERWNVDVDKIKEDLRADIAIGQTRLDEVINEYGTGE